jgi:hypothetical protein
MSTSQGTDLSNSSALALSSGNADNGLGFDTNSNMGVGVNMTTGGMGNMADMGNMGNMDMGIGAMGMSGFDPNMEALNYDDFDFGGMTMPGADGEDFESMLAEWPN